MKFKKGDRLIAIVAYPKHFKKGDEIIVHQVSSPYVLQHKQTGLLFRWSNTEWAASYFKLYVPKPKGHPLTKIFRLTLLIGLLSF